MDAQRTESPATWPNNRLTARLGIRYPIVQGPFGGLATQKLTAAVSNFGCLGSFGALGLAPDAIRDVVAELRSLTDKPFAINLWVSTEDSDAAASDEAAFRRSLAPLAWHFETLGAPLPAYQPQTTVKFEDQVRAVIDARVPVFSFIVGIPPKEILDECRARGIVTLGAATTPDEAAALQQAGVDVIVASGFEAGGHRGSFLRPAEDSITGTFALVPQVADRVDVPVVAAGGIADARGIAAALALGADGVQIGTAFLTCKDSGATPLHREMLLRGGAGHTGLTRGFTGRLARGIKNQLMDELNQPGAAILPYPLQRYLVRCLSGPAEKAGRADLVPMWAGQSASLSRFEDATELLQALVDEVSAIAGPVMQWRQSRRRTHSS